MLRSFIYYDQNILLDEDKTKSTQTCVILVTPLLSEILAKSLGCLVEIPHIDVLGVPLPEEEGMEQLPDLSIAPVLAQNVSRVFVTINMVKSDGGSCNGFTNSVKR